MSDTMMHFSSFSQTPRSVKILLWLLGITSFLAPLLTFGLHYYFHLLGPSEWLALSRGGLLQGWWWQPLTYIFVHTSGTSISLSFFISLAFSLFLLWFSASALATRFGSKAFFLLYFSATLFAGVIASLYLLLFSSTTPVVGNSPPLYALLLVWLLLYPNQELSFFYLFRLKAKALITLFFGIALLLDLSSGQFSLFLADLSGIVWGWILGTLIFLKKRKKGSGKIIDISVIQESDEAFMDRMLDKISMKGEGALTRRERERMEKISRSKK